MGKSSPRVSIIIPCYNAEKWIKQCVISALAQTHSDTEVIVVDNESADGSYATVERLLDDNPRLTLEIAKNIYPHCWDEAREKGFSLATGKYFFTLASDDYLHPEYVENYLKYFNNGNVKVYALASAIRSVDSNGVDKGSVNHSYRSLKELRETLLSKCPINSPTVAYDRELYDGGHLVTNPDKFGGAADYDLYCSLVDKGYFIYPTDRWLGYYYRWHEGQATWQVHKEAVDYDKMIQEFWRDRWKI